MENTNNQIVLGLNIEQTMHLIQEQLNKIAEKVRGMNMENTNNQIVLGLNIEQTMHLIQEQLNKIAEKVRG